jgi:hypothetical protein
MSRNRIVYIRTVFLRVPPCADAPPSGRPCWLPLDAEAEKQDRELYEDIIPFVRGESNTIQAGTIEMDKAKIAEGLSKVTSPSCPAQVARADRGCIFFLCPGGGAGAFVRRPNKKSRPKAACWTSRLRRELLLCGPAALASSKECI